MHCTTWAIFKHDYFFTFSCLLFYIFLFTFCKHKLTPCKNRNICFCFSPVQYPRERQPETMVLLNNLVAVVENVKQCLKLNQVDVLCHLVECFITSIVLQMKGNDLQDECGNKNSAHDRNSMLSFEPTNGIPKQMSSLRKKQNVFVNVFLITNLSSNLEGSRDAEWHQELQVSKI